MAVVAVTANNSRIEDSEATTGWSNRGGGAGVAAEAPLAYQGTNTVNRKITSSTGAGFEYDPAADSGSAQDMTATATSHWMVKAIVSDAGGLRSNDGLRMIIGDSTNEYVFIIAGTDAVKNAYNEYLLRTATLIVPINPNISGYRDGTHSSGTVTLTAVDVFGVDAEFATATAKAENVGVDAIDLGTGLTLVGGDGGDADGVWSDFVDEDEGTVNNRWGYANSIYGTSGVLFFFGTMTIGSATATEFSDTTAQILWPDGLFGAGFSGVSADLQSASTTITDGATHTSLGTTNTEDTRADYTWTGTSGTGTASHTLNNFRNYIMTSAVTLDGGNIEIADLTQASGTIQNSTIRCNSASGVAVCNDPTFTSISNTNFIQAGSGHAFEITSTGTYTFTDLTFNGFGGTAGTNSTPSSGANDAMIYNNSGGAVTINISGGDSVSVRNGASATTTVSAAAPITLTNLIAGSRVYIENTTDSVVLFNEIEATTTFSNSVSYTTDKTLLIRVRSASSSPYYKPFTTGGILTSNGFSLQVNQELDE